MKNYWQIRTLPISRYVKYMYLDTDPYTADQIFINHELHVKFCKGEMKHPKYKSVVICNIKVKNRDTEKFKACMELLMNAIMLKGNKEYFTACNLLNDEFN